MLAKIYLQSKVLFAIVGSLASISLGLVFGFVPVAILSAFKNRE